MATKPLKTGKEFAAYLFDDPTRNALKIKILASLTAQERAGKITVRGKVDTDALIAVIADVFVENHIEKNPYRLVKTKRV